MIKQLIFLFFLLLGFGCISQVEFYSHNSLGYDTTNILNGTTVNISDDSSFFELTMGCKNTSPGDLNLTIRRKIFSYSWSFLNDQLCDNNLCYIPSSNDFTAPASNLLAVGEICTVKSSFMFSNNNTSIYVRYYALDDNLNMIDSVDFALNNATNINQGINQSDIMISSLQNNSEIFVSNTGNYSKLNFKIYNILGTLISEKLLSNKNSTIDVNLPTGTFIVRVDYNGKILKSKKITAF